MKDHWMVRLHDEMNPSDWITYIPHLLWWGSILLALIVPVDGDR